LKKEQAIGVGKLDPTAHLAMKHDQLTSERSILSLKPTDRPERRTNSLIHKSQGSEYPAVVIPIMTQHYAMLQRNLLYTGVTRGKRLVVLVGQKKAVTIAVRDAATRRASTNAAGPHGGSGFSAESAGAALARWVEPAWTLLAFDGLRALRQEPSAGQSAIRIATELSRFFDESLQNMRPIITRRELTFRWGRAPYTRSIERFGDIVAHPVLGGSHLGTLESSIRKRQLAAARPLT
jgi:hypothetical protein